MYCCIDLMQNNNYSTKKKNCTSPKLLYPYTVYIMYYSIRMEILL